MRQHRDRQRHSSLPPPLWATAPPAAGEECSPFSGFWLQHAPVTAITAVLLACSIRTVLWSPPSPSPTLIFSLSLSLKLLHLLDGTLCLDSSSQHELPGYNLRNLTSSSSHSSSGESPSASSASTTVLRLDSKFLISGKNLPDFPTPSQYQM